MLRYVHNIEKYYGTDHVLFCQHSLFYSIQFRVVDDPAQNVALFSAGGKRNREIEIFLVHFTSFLYPLYNFYGRSDRRPFHDLVSLGFCHRRGCYWLLFMGLHREPFSGE